MCFSTLYMFYEFKKKCSYTAEIIESFIEDNQHDGVLDLNDVLAYLNYGEVEFILCVRIFFKQIFCRT